ncbi:MAG TPA: bifunctional DNA-formamidopyrimidine glycosylase/DNA-(apurinic or apyrimidinic site) lyase [Candidatus Thalassarchaeaceae archaeon]|jgi:formamidopyrimidine-DNA glycosylase|nr:DNA-formamidopyrimidine glycosylase [Euryarchaeota archaeon]DAC42685.1 MAG TPA: bifunctional DNA-formamidopyrimidine glycosylase/DNA-(apurinic or apyrimidinic site) lyase [Candidatus Poseidoniales archaeon]HII35332.1 bifunctional DNA-formamidopyrimidine glycosylase/DNA-(apurinic or apyrimidinic site) lyase [Candidatus Thalassarchaeaceae archaeon]|tara:strand:+ start:1430 stop:2323 length:894 start_codon:yes stop_codon:yes gene_type:complete
MPELPEVETVRRGLSRHLIGRKVVELQLRRNDLRFPFPESFKQQIEDSEIISIDRRAKYLLIRLNSGVTWLSHLGMSGRWTLIGGGRETRPGRFQHGAEIGTGNGPHDWVVAHLDDGGKAVYSDHRRFGIMDCFPTDSENENKLLSKLGPEPTPDQLTPLDLADSLRGRRTPIKSALLDQRIVAGLGNIYVCEILHRSGVSPRRTAANVAGRSGTSKRVEKITYHTHDVITEAIDSGGSTLQDFRGVEGDDALGYFPQSFGVYGREGEKCTKSECDGSIRRIVQSNRSTFYCPECQN